MPVPEFLNLQQAAEFGGFKTVVALQAFVRRWNASHAEEQRIIRRHGRVHFASFAAALRADTYTTPDPAKPLRGAATVHA